ncbi:MAG: DUF3467 domain-containing protein [Armatimonadota bacterium]
MAQEADFEVVYSNVAKITHVAFEVLMDFKRQGPETPNAESAPTLVRVIMHPVIAKAFLDALTENLRKYEEKFGPIPTAPPGADHPVH